MNKRIIMRILRFPWDVVFDPRSANHTLAHWESMQRGTILFNISQKYAQKITGDELKINIGCGDGWRHEGWLGLDYTGVGIYPNTRGSKNGVNINWDVLRGLPFSDQTVQAIFMSHVFEHFTYNESLFVLRECHRVLKPKGQIRLVVPDMDLFYSKISCER